MLDFIKEKTDCWEFLRSTELPIFIYGMGDGAEKILRVFDMYNIPTAGFFASDEFVRGHYFKGHLVHSLSQIEALIDDFIIVLAFGAGYESLYNRINDMAKRHTLLAPDVPVVGDGLFTYSYCMENADKLQKGETLFSDGYAIREGKTSPPKRYTSGSMVLAMENAGQLIEEEELRENILTPAHSHVKGFSPILLGLAMMKNTSTWALTTAIPCWNLPISQGENTAGYSPWSLIQGTSASLPKAPTAWSA